MKDIFLLCPDVKEEMTSSASKDRLQIVDFMRNRLTSIDTTRENSTKYLGLDRTLAAQDYEEEYKPQRPRKTRPVLMAKNKLSEQIADHVHDMSDDKVKFLKDLQEYIDEGWIKLMDEESMVAMQCDGFLLNADGDLIMINSR